MNLLVYLEPLHELDNPFWHEPWLGFTEKMATTLKKRWPGSRTVCVTNSALASISQERSFDLVVLDHTELVPRFGGSALAVASLWDAGGSWRTNRAMAGVIKARLPNFKPDACVSFSPAPFLRIAFPKAPVLFFEHGMVSRPPFPLTGYLDPFDLLRNSALVCLKHQIRNFQPTAEEASLVSDLREAYFAYIHANNPLKETISNWRGQFDRLLLFGGQFSGFYAFDCYTDAKSPLDLLLRTLEQVEPNVGVIATEHPNRPFLSERTVEWVSKTYPNFLWSPDFNNTTWRAASQWVMPHVDAVATVNSKVGLESLLWKKPLVVLGSSHLDAIADSNNLSDLESICSHAWPDWKESVLLWHLTRYTIPFDILFGDGVFCERLVQAKEHHVKSTMSDFYQKRPCPLITLARNYKNHLQSALLPEDFDTATCLRLHRAVAESRDAPIRGEDAGELSLQRIAKENAALATALGELAGRHLRLASSCHDAKAH